jgi:deazaflavin-dependent oxidoreductase (nitroreductase family)
MSDDRPAQDPRAWIQRHIELYKTDPEKAHYINLDMVGGKGQVPTLLLTTKGRKTGKLIPTPLIYGRVNGNYVVVASKGGSPTHPHWYLNLVANPEVEIQVVRERYHARARTAGPDERKRLWKEMAKIFPPYDEYQARAGREIPIVVLEPKT